MNTNNPKKRIDSDTQIINSDDELVGNFADYIHAILDIYPELVARRNQNDNDTS